MVCAARITYSARIEATGVHVATPNYGYEKRQKELAKKQKKQEKLRAKAERKTGVGDDPQEPGDEQGSPEQALPGQTPPGHAGPASVGQ